MGQPTHRLRSASSYITPLFCSMIANVANRAPVSTYISQVTGNHPTSTGLSMARHIFDPGPIIGLKYMFGQGSSMHQVFPNQLL